MPPSEGQTGRNVPFRQKLDMDLNVKSENAQLIGKNILHMENIWLHLFCSITFWSYILMSGLNNDMEENVDLIHIICDSNKMLSSRGKSINEKQEGIGGDTRNLF